MNSRHSSTTPPPPILRRSVPCSDRDNRSKKVRQWPTFSSSLTTHRLSHHSYILKRVHRTHVYPFRYTPASTFFNKMSNNIIITNLSPTRGLDFCFEFFKMPTRLSSTIINNFFRKQLYVNVNFFKQPYIYAITFQDL